MKFEEALKIIKKGKKVYNKNWNGLKNGKCMFVRVQKPDENSMNTYLYLVMEVYDLNKKNYRVIVPWFPSNLDLFSDQWFELG